MNAKVKQLSDFDDPNAQVTGKKRYFIFDSQIFQKKKMNVNLFSSAI